MAMGALAEAMVIGSGASGEDRKNPRGHSSGAKAKTKRKEEEEEVTAGKVISINKSHGDGKVSRRLSSLAEDANDEAFTGSHGWRSRGPHPIVGPSFRSISMGPARYDLLGRPLTRRHPDRVLTPPVCARPPASQSLRRRAELVRMSGDSGVGSGVLMLEWRSPGEEGIVLLGSTAGSCKDVGSGVLMLEWRSPGEEGIVLLGSAAGSCKDVGSGRFPT
ncbi:hypothetical protein BHM03_00035402 [Ensete ventricosum]|nr:hypothetical protein BHM03_00035402 [Ensete ventricosum]